MNSSGLAPRLKSCALVGAVFSISAAHLAHAEGFRNPPAGGFGLSRAGGRIAQIDDPSSVVHNPANMTDLQEAQAQASALAVYISIHHEAPNGQTAKTRDPWKLLPSFFYAVPFGEGKFAAGLGITSPYGLSNEWEKSGEFGPGGNLRYAAPYFTELKTINATPAIAYKFNDQLQFGAGLDVMWSELTLERILGFGVGVPEGSAHVKATGFGWGGHAGITWSITSNQRLALTYRSPIHVDYSGTSTLHTPIGSTEGSAWSSVTYPTIVSLGYGIKLSDTVRIESDLEWLQFSNFDRLDFLLSNAPGAGAAENWRNTFTIGVAGDWAFAPDWMLRAGYQFYKTPIRDNTFSPTIPDSDQNVFTAGLRYKHGHHAGEIAYGGIFYRDRNIARPPGDPFAGKYQMMVHLFAVAYNYSF